MKDKILYAVDNSKDGIEVDKLKINTKLFIETENSIYEMVILKNSTEEHKIIVEITGGVKQDGSIRYKNPTKVFFTGSTFGGSILKMNWIGKNMQMEIFDNKVFTTSEVKNVVIENPKGDWTYSMDWNKWDQV